MYRLILLVHLTLALEIRLESLDNGPGILSFKLGSAKVITHYHSFVQYLDLSDLETQLMLIHHQLDNFRNQLDDNTLAIFELQLDYLETKLVKIDSKLKSLEPNLSECIKRGLINGLGSFVKSITGNLDHSDAERYNNAITLLENNQQKLVSEFNNLVNLNKDWMAHYTSIIPAIVDNQQQINETLSSILDKVSEVKFAKMAQLLAIISESTEDLYLELINLEDILAFIRASSTQHSMINIDNLEYILTKLRKLYSSDEILDAELREFYNVIKPGSYFMGMRIVIVFKFPIVSSDNFDFYRLSIVPNKLQQTFIPPYPFMATDGKLFIYMEAECPKFGHHLLCEQDANHYPREHPDCVQSIIINRYIDKSWSPMKIRLNKEVMEQLDDQHYILVFPKPTRVELQCGRQDYISLSGSYLATIPYECSLRTETFKIINMNNKNKGQPLKLIEIPNSYDSIEDNSIPHMMLNSINLQSLHHLEDRIILQHPINLNRVDQSLYHTTVPLYALLVCTAMTGIIIYTRRYILGNKTTRGQGGDGEKPQAVEVLCANPIGGSLTMPRLHCACNPISHNR